MKTEKELKEGCGEIYGSNIKTSLGLKKIKICGASGSCLVCEAKLKTLQERNTEVEQAIKYADEETWTKELFKNKLLQKLGLGEGETNGK